MREPRKCANCGAAGTGRFCSTCGQRYGIESAGLGDLAREAVSALGGPDSRLLATLRLLVTRPGRLITEYQAGRRTAYLPPVRLYLGLGAIFLAVFALLSPIDLAGEPARRLLENLGRTFGDGGLPEPLLLERFEARYNSFYPFAVAATVPFLALLLKLLYPRRRLYDHVVFVIYLLALSWLAGLVTLPLVPVSLSLYSTLNLAVFAVYLFPAIGRVYGGRVAVRAIKGLVLLLANLMLAGVAGILLLVAAYGSAVRLG